MSDIRVGSMQVKQVRRDLSAPGRILLGVHSLSPGGTERVVSTLLNAFSRVDGLEVHCVLYGRHPACFYSVREAVTLHLPHFDFDATLRAVSMLKTVRHIRRVVRKVQPDIMLNFGERWNNLVLASVAGLRVPVLVADRSSPDLGLGFVHERLRRLLYARAAGVIVQTQEAASKLASSLPDSRQVHVIPNPLFEFPEQKPSERAREVLFVGRLIPSKNVDRLIRNFATARIAGWRLTIVGGDAQGHSELKKLWELVVSLGLEESVNLEGMQTDVRRFYRRASIFAFPSSSEGFPNALAEALAFGLPAIAYDCSAGPADLISDGKNGYLVPVFDDETFAQRLRELMRDDGLRKRMSENAILSMKHLDKDSIALRFLEACGLANGYNHGFVPKNTFAHAARADNPD